MQIQVSLDTLSHLFSLQNVSAVRQGPSFVPKTVLDTMRVLTKLFVECLHEYSDLGLCRMSNCTRHSLLGRLHQG